MRSFSRISIFSDSILLQIYLLDGNATFWKKSGNWLKQTFHPISGESFTSFLSNRVRASKLAFVIGSQDLKIAHREENGLFA